MSIVKIEDFFKFGIQEPINRIAYSKEDADYKLMCMKRMQDLGMKIKIDELGNITGTLPGNGKTKKKLVMGSHTDSVFNGGQYDGVLGVYSALAAVESIKESHKDRDADVVAVIWACEESSFFGKACLGSRYSATDISKQQTALEQLKSLKGKDGFTADVTIKKYIEYIKANLESNGIDPNNVSYPQNVLGENDITEFYELHIEQASVLAEAGIPIGVVTSIAEPVREKMEFTGADAIHRAADAIIDLTNLTTMSVSNRKEDLRLTIPQFDSSASLSRITCVSSEKQQLFQVEAFGENAHSGAAPMDKRKDAVLALARLISELPQGDSAIKWLDVSTPKWGTNQVQNYVSAIGRLNCGLLNPNYITQNVIPEIEQYTGVKFKVQDLESAEVPQDLKVNLTVDARQQHDRTGDGTSNQIYGALVAIQDKNNSKTNMCCRVTDKKTPVKTSRELVKEIVRLCKENGIPCEEMVSWAGHDCAFVIAEDGKKILVFVPSTGGSHNKEEATTPNAVETGTFVMTTLLGNRLDKIKEKLRIQGDSTQGRNQNGLHTGKGDFERDL